jgi:FAD synthase
MFELRGDVRVQLTAKFFVDKERMGRGAYLTDMILRGMVIVGKKIAGPYYGYPTANVFLKKTPKDLQPGVYAARVSFGDKKNLPAVVCYGANIRLGKAGCEVHLLQAPGDLYGKNLTVRLLELIGGIIPFRSVKQMKEKIRQDVERARVILCIPA